MQVAARRGGRRRVLLTATIATLALALSGPTIALSAQANVRGDNYNSATADTQVLGYNRMIRLSNSGASYNGQLISTTERSNTNGVESGFEIKRSTDDGASWTTISTVPGEAYTYQPALFEFPQAVGAYPAGTLMLWGVTLPGDRSTTTMRQWRSADHGVTWSQEEIVQFAVGDDGEGLWEPEVELIGGKLVLYFSDERQRATWSQYLGHIVSNDGGDSWSANPDGSTNYAPGIVQDVASASQKDRPGMMTVARNEATGTYIGTYEICGPKNCQVYFKTSSDGLTWGSGASDLGTAIQTDDSRVLFSTPTAAWSPAGGVDGQFIVTAYREVRTTGGVGETGQVMFLNTDDGAGSWRWAPTPIYASPASWTQTCLGNYSPFILPSVNGASVRYTTEANFGAHGCTTVTGSFNTSVLPYAASFANGDPGWVRYGGTWSTASNVLSESKGGYKAVTGSTAWKDYTLQGDVRIATASGNAGFLIRVTDPTEGTDTARGYFIGVNGSALVIGRQNYNWTQLGSTPLAGGLATNTWYHLSVAIDGCDITVQGRPAGSSAPTTNLSVSDCTFSHGAIGVRSFGTAAGWRYITVDER
ncbi:MULTISPECIES: hypothetical protein [Plantibacter]|uniref:hypothetical protein n=1 Tax=Plantibacter TaxID=190323 RepID=UPI0010C1B553|nr:MULTISPECIES: hypothetical protein [Plantibacter]MBD8467349.1 hypothetical protein [Plantibacter sp. CFBP 8798]